MGRALDNVFAQLRRVAAVQALGGLSDRELLERFVAANDEPAFTVLIERHGPMVFGVCRRALANRHDREDACQATFLVLAHKAESLRKKESLGSWLHGVACRVSARLKRDAIRRKNRERGSGRPAPTDPAAEVSWREVQAALDEELQRLPERYRAPLVLCYPECLTRDEAARRLGLSEGGLHGRLERGRHLLRQRLTGRGLTLSAAMSASVLGESVPGTALLPPTFIVSSARAATLLAAGQPLTESAVGAYVLALTREVLQSMSLSTVKLGAAAVLCAALLALAGGSFVSLGFAQDAKPEQQFRKWAHGLEKPESEADFIRRISIDLRGGEPTPAEVHFFVASKDAGKRQKLIDLFIQERKARKEAMRAQQVARDLDELILQVWGFQNTRRLEALQKEFYKELHAAKDKAEVAKVTQSHLDRLIEWVTAHPAGPEVSEAIRQIVLVYESQGKAVEAAAWRAKLSKEAPKGTSGGGEGTPPLKACTGEGEQSSRAGCGSVVTGGPPVLHPEQAGRLQLRLSERRARGECQAPASLAKPLAGSDGVALAEDGCQRAPMGRGLPACQPCQVLPRRTTFGENGCQVSLIP